MLRRPRRNRKNEGIRSLVRQTQVTTDDLIFPLFLIEGYNQKQEVISMPGIYRLTSDLMLKEIEYCMGLGIRSFDVFPIVSEKDKTSEAIEGYREDSFYLRTLREIKARLPESHIITDIAMDPYSSDGHDGLVKEGKILNDATLEILGKMALAQAETGIDMIGPSDMMDGRIGYLRELLDQQGFQDVGIMSYTAKYASTFYGPFRDALDSAPKFGDKKTYQMDPANREEALLEAQLDYEEGADILMVKPALTSLDIISDFKQNFPLPIAAYNVSGQYSMIKAAAQKGWLDSERAMQESLTAIKRSGADIILTYFAKEFAEGNRK
tara:strand:+ start:655 stop:1626 length:972 start_codon:yes stop_codon:yes gene_type:complete